MLIRAISQTAEFQARCDAYLDNCLPILDYLVTIEGERLKGADIKLLYAKSGGKCSICRANTVHKRSDGSEYHTSEVAHIRGKEAAALRHDSTMSKDEIDDISNLIVLCSKCHTMIDNNDTDYTVEVLLRLKDEHETWVETQLGRKTSDVFQVDFIDCVHIEESDSFIYHMDLSLVNKTMITMRINNITIFDGESKLEYIRRGQTSPPDTMIEIRGNETHSWDCFCKGKSKDEKDMIELSLVIERRGKREFRKQIASMLVSNGDFPSGDFIFTFDWSGRHI